MRIWKWHLDVTDRQTISMPKGAKILDVQIQKDKCCLWALCDENAEEEPRTIAIYGTGNPIPDEHGEHIATFQLPNYGLVFHAFDLTPRD